MVYQMAVSCKLFFVVSEKTVSILIESQLLQFHLKDFQLKFRFAELFNVQRELVLQFSKCAVSNTFPYRINRSLNNFFSFHENHEIFPTNHEHIPKIQRYHWRRLQKYLK